MKVAWCSLILPRHSWKISIPDSKGQKARSRGLITSYLDVDQDILKNHRLKKVAWSDSLIIDGTREVDLQWIKVISDLMEVSIGKALLLHSIIRAFLYTSL